VHTLEFAEISESVVLKHNTEQKKTQHIIPLVTSSRCPPLRCSHYAGRSWTLLMALRNTSTGILEISSCIRSANPSVIYAWHCFLTVPVSWNDAQPTGEDFVRMMLSASMFCRVRTVLTLPPFFLTVEPVSSKLFTHVFMAWDDGTLLFRWIPNFLRNSRWAAT